MKFRGAEIRIVKGDITELAVDAIVNASNTELSMEKGVAKVIKDKGGESIEQDAQKNAPIDIGQAVWTTAGQLRANYVIHTAAVKKGHPTDQKKLRMAVANAFKVAQELKIISIALPALGCGDGQFPKVGAAKIITQEIMKIMREENIALSEITLCLFDEETYEIFSRTIYSYLRHIQENLGPGPYVTVDMLIEREDGLILVERSNPPFGWALPGGFLDYGESLELAARREAKEETNLDLEEMRQFHTYSDPNRDPRFQTITTVFVGKGVGDPQAGDDAASLKVVPYDQLLDLEYAFDHKEIIKDYLDSKK